MIGATMVVIDEETVTAQFIYHQHGNSHNTLKSEPIFFFPVGDRTQPHKLWRVAYTVRSFDLMCLLIGLAIPFHIENAGTQVRAPSDKKGSLSV
jgi:hypothetical protein